MRSFIHSLALLVLAVLLTLPFASAEAQGPPDHATVAALDQAAARYFRAELADDYPGAVKVDAGARGSAQRAALVASFQGAAAAKPARCQYADDARPCMVGPGEVYVAVVEHRREGSSAVAVLEVLTNTGKPRGIALWRYHLQLAQRGAAWHVTGVEHIQHLH